MPSLIQENNEVQYTYYHAGPLFNIADISTNIALSQAIYRLSNEKFRPILPQNLDLNNGPQGIRDRDLRTLLSCDLALFTYDGCEVDSGTVVEYMTAKMADTPAVILRSDFRGAGDQEGKGDPWTLMSSYFPRTSRVVIQAMNEYKTCMEGIPKKVKSPSALEQNEFGPQAATLLIDCVARQVIAAFEEVLAKPARMPETLRESVFRWIALMPEFGEGDNQSNTAEMLELLKAKQEKGLFAS